MKVLIPLATLAFGITIGWLLPRTGTIKPQTRPPLLPSLGEVTGDTFALTTVLEETTGHRIIPIGPEHAALRSHLIQTAGSVARRMSQPDSPARRKRRINEVSALFEEALLAEISAHPDFTCTFPQTKDGRTQRSGYPDLRVEHHPTGTVAYLDPKLFEETSVGSSFRTFYYEPSPGRTKVTEDALHLLLGFPHDGKTQAWTFGPPTLVDLSSLKVTLKAEFSASNRDLYSPEEPATECGR